MIEIILSMLMALSFNSSEQDDWNKDRVWFSMTDEQRQEASIDLKAHAVGLSVEDFELMSRVVEAESDRTDNFEAKVLIAETIWNRAYDNRFPDTVRGVVCQSGQFSVVSNGRVSVGRNNLSDMAIIEAHRRIAEGDAPHVIYFNCIGYNYLGTPYCKEGDNYFEIA